MVRREENERDREKRIRRLLEDEERARRLNEELQHRLRKLTKKRLDQEKQIEQLQKKLEAASQNPHKWAPAKKTKRSQDVGSWRALRLPLTPFTLIAPHPLFHLQRRLAWFFPASAFFARPSRLKLMFNPKNVKQKTNTYYNLRDMFDI